MIESFVHSWPALLRPVVHFEEFAIGSCCAGAVKPAAIVDANKQDREAPAAQTAPQQRGKTPGHVTFIKAAWKNGWTRAPRVKWR